MPVPRPPDLRVRASDGVQLAVYRDGKPGAPIVLMLHGYPDNASVWDQVAELLADRFQVVRYDVRGAGASDHPSGRLSYRLDQLVADFEAVLDAVAPAEPVRLPAEPVHLLAHDWGSIQAWQCVTDQRLASRIASFTSISGPCLGQVPPWVAASVRSGRPGQLLRQLVHSYYLLAFQVPVLPELLWRSGLLDRILAGGGTNTALDERQRSGPVRYRRQLPDKIHGLQLYRANLFGRRPAPVRGGRYTEVPVQVLAPSADPFVTRSLQLQAPEPFVRSLRQRPVPGGHWLPVTDPGLVARASAEFIELAEQARR
jgi:pimeloyl-ACP methyl ester carboxylesterase